MIITEITEENFKDWHEMACELWPEEDQDEMIDILHTVLNDSRNKNYLCKTDNGEAVGFINISIRGDYVEGSKSSPVVFIEGVFVKEKFRKRGIAKNLVKTAEQWGKEMGCKEIGSDAYAINKDSRNFHKQLGFNESEPIVVFIKKINETKL